MDLKQFCTGPMQVNTYLCVDESQKKGFIVDPGGVSKELDDYIASHDYDIKHIILTHGHGDHICGVPHYIELLGAQTVGMEADNYLFNDAGENMSRAFTGKSIEFTPDIYVHDGDTMDIAGLHLKFMHTPGHTLGGMSILLDNVLFSGDTLFQDSIGRTDFKGGSFEALKNSVHEKLFVLPDDTIVLPGHMGQTTIGHEKKFNPFL